MPANPLVLFGAACVVGAGIILWELSRPARFDIHGRRMEAPFSEKYEDGETEDEDEEDVLERHYKHTTATASGNRYTGLSGVTSRSDRKVIGSGLESGTQDFEEKARVLSETFPHLELFISRIILTDHEGDLDKSLEYVKRQLEMDSSADAPATLHLEEPMKQVENRISLEPVKSEDLTEKKSEEATREDLLSELSYLTALEQEVERKKAALVEEQTALQALSRSVNDMRVTIQSSGNSATAHPTVDTHVDARDTVATSDVPQVRNAAAAEISELESVTSFHESEHSSDASWSDVMDDAKDLPSGNIA